MLTEYATTHNATYIDTNQAKELLSQATTARMSDYTSNTNVATYPIKVLYAYIKLCLLYNS